ncbi:MAG: hypothetical protein AAGM22_07995 [Acidobacteriota bacterium]
MVRDNMGDFLLTGLLDGTVDIDPGMGVSTLTSTGDDIFLAKLDSNGHYLFDGFNDHVDATDHLALDFGTGDFTIDAWIRTTDSDATIVSKRQVINGKYVGYLLMVHQGRLLFQMGTYSAK